MIKILITKKQKRRENRKLYGRTLLFLNVKTNDGKSFFKILSKNCRKTNPLSKIFNKNTVEIKYSCTRNVKPRISGHNKKIMYRKPQQYGCSCSDKNNCPLDNKCSTQQIVYQADVTNDTDDTYKYYLGLAELSLKDRYRNNILFFNNEQHKNKKKLSKYVRSLTN